MSSRRCCGGMATATRYDFDTGLLCREVEAIFEMNG